MDSGEIVLVIWLSLRISLRQRESLMILMTTSNNFSKTSRKPTGTSIAVCLNCQQNAQKGSSARPQRAKMRRVRFGTLSF
jgi:hypothetical protein